MENNITKNKQDLLKEKQAELFLKLKNAWPLSRISGRIFFIYLLIVLCGGLLLSIPGIVIPSDGNDFGWDYMTAIFTAVSAFSDTGVNIADASHNYSFWGQLIIVILIEIGGIGVLTIKIILFILINKKISLDDTSVAQSERGGSVKSSTIELIKDGFIFISLVQLVAAGALFFLFFYSNPGSQSDNLIVNGVNDLNVISPFHDFDTSLWFAIFHSTSAINNAGFDIVSSNSLQPYNVENHYSYGIQAVFLFEWVIGGLGYPTYHDIKKKIQARRTGTKVRFSLFTKLNFFVYVPLLIFGPVLVYLSEFANADTSLIFNKFTYELAPITNQPINLQITEAKSTTVVIMDIIFNTTACRNAGFSTVGMDNFNGSSKVLLSTFMFIGSAPSSTAGGIRTTTFAIIVLATLSIIRNTKNTSAFKKNIPVETVRRAYAVFFISVIIVGVSVLGIYINSYDALINNNSINNDENIVKLLMLITSAYGTVGMNPFTQAQMINFGVLSKILILICMFLGQLGVSNTLLAFIRPSKKVVSKYLDEDVTIG